MDFVRRTIDHLSRRDMREKPTSSESMDLRVLQRMIGFAISC